MYTSLNDMALLLMNYTPCSSRPTSAARVRASSSVFLVSSLSTLKHTSSVPSLPVASLAYQLAPSLNCVFPSAGSWELKEDGRL